MDNTIALSALFHENLDMNELIKTSRELPKIGKNGLVTLSSELLMEARDYYFSLRGKVGSIEINNIDSFVGNWKVLYQSHLDKHIGGHEVEIKKLGPHFLEAEYVYYDGIKGNRLKQVSFELTLDSEKNDSFEVRASQHPLFKHFKRTFCVPYFDEELDYFIVSDFFAAKYWVLSKNPIDDLKKRKAIYSKLEALGFHI